MTSPGTYQRRLLQGLLKDDFSGDFSKMTSLGTSPAGLSSPGPSPGRASEGLDAPF